MTTYDHLSIEDKLTILGNLTPEELEPYIELRIKATTARLSKHATPTLEDIHQALDTVSDMDNWRDLASNPNRLGFMQFQIGKSMTSYRAINYFRDKGDMRWTLGVMQPCYNDMLELTTVEQVILDSLEAKPWDEMVAVAKDRLSQALRILEIET